MHDELDSEYGDLADFSDIHWFSWATTLKKSLGFKEQKPTLY